MPSIISKILESNTQWIIARLVVLVLFVSSGLAKITIFWAIEHVAVIGGLIAVAITGHFRGLYFTQTA